MKVAPDRTGVVELIVGLDNASHRQDYWGHPLTSCPSNGLKSVPAWRFVMAYGSAL